MTLTVTDNQYGRLS